MPHEFSEEEDGEQQMFSENPGTPVFAEDPDVLDATGETAEAEQFVAEITKESDDTSNMSEAERRLDLASYYSQILRNPIFDLDTSGAQQVDAELRAFAEERLQVLLGIREDDRPMALAKPTPPQFTDEEAAVLRKFAAITEAEQKVFWALLATAARSKTVVGTLPAKPVAPAPVAPPTIRRVAAPTRAPAPARSAAPASRQVAPRQAPARPAAAPRAAAPAPAPAAPRRPARPAAPAAPKESAAPPPPRPLPMPRGAALEGTMQSLAISQSRQGEKMDETRRRGGDAEIHRQ